MQALIWGLKCLLSMGPEHVENVTLNASNISSIITVTMNDLKTFPSWSNNKIMKHIQYQQQPEDPYLSVNMSHFTCQIFQRINFDQRCILSSAV